MILKNFYAILLNLVKNSLLILTNTVGMRYNIPYDFNKQQFLIYGG